MTTLHFAVPVGIDDPLRPSGGNVYDRRVIEGLTALGWQVREHPVRSLGEALGALPDGALVLVDGLVTSGAASAVASEAHRLRLVVLLHMPTSQPEERTVLSAAAGVVATSRWTRQWVLDNYGLPNERVHVAAPGTDAADAATGTASGGELRCVGAVTAGKGHDVLAAALAAIADLPWQCLCVGALDLEPEYVEELRAQVRDHGLEDRVFLTGPLTGPGLDAVYAGGDLLVSASRAESYGMVISEALARGLPVIATDVGGVREALGDPGAGVLVPPDDVPALAAALRHWLTDSDQRARLRAAARARRETLSDWRRASRLLAGVLAEYT